MSVSLLKALEAVKANRETDSGNALHCALFCGFTPLHLQTFLHAALCGLSKQRRVLLRQGLYGDLLGSLLNLLSEDVSLEFAVVAMEWEDFDARLGLRSFGGWSTATHDDILDSVCAKVALYSDYLRRLTSKMKVVLSLPSTPFLPLHHSDRRRSSCWESALKGAISLLPEHLLPLKSFQLLNHELLGRCPAYDSRYSAESHLAYGFPYSLDYAETLGRELAMLAMPQPPLKGIVLDLDNTLWKGILGEDGIQGVSWDLDRSSHIYGVFQAFVQSLAEAGILVAVASKNDPTLVEELFSHRKTPLKRDSIFPLEANWGRKSLSIRRILGAWNIGAGDVVFVDDSPLEVEEVRMEFPEMKLFTFPAGRADEILALIYTLRGLFGKDAITKEDSLRLESLKQREKILAVSHSGDENYEALLRENMSKVSLISLSPSGDDRAFELLNKTNQFNMNGLRVTETEWKDLCNKENGFVIVVDYEDRFGPLGKIAVMAGFKKGQQAVITHWVMSCRAFGRRIEHGLLGCVFDKYKPLEVLLYFRRTERNGPFEEFLDLMGAKELPEGWKIGRDAFVERCPALYHDVEVVEG